MVFSNILNFLFNVFVGLYDLVQPFLNFLATEIPGFIVDDNPVTVGGALFGVAFVGVFAYTLTKWVIPV